METVAIVGVGLIGGSFALALKRAGFSGRIIGVSSPATVEEALRLRVIDEALPLDQAVPRSDLIYLSQPISRILDTIPRVDELARTGALITDAGSTKADIVGKARQHIRRAHFLGGHPMAGKESRGVGAAAADLFERRPYVLTPLQPAAADFPPVRELLDWIRRIGATPVFLTPEEHDRVVAFTSHLPQLLSTTLAATLAGQSGLTGLDQVAGPGLLDSTRLALSPFDIWRDILATNATFIDEALAALLAELQEVRSQLPSADLAEQFGKAAAFSARVRGRQALWPAETSVDPRRLRYSRE